MRHLTSEPGVEVRGEVLIALVDNMQAAAMAPYLEKHGLVGIQAGEWYPVKNYQDFLNDMSERANQSSNFTAIGVAIASTAHIPLDTENATLEQIVQAWDDIYQSNHRGGDIGYKTIERIDDNYYVATLHGGLYPDDFEYGVIYGLVKRFAPGGMDFTVWYDEDVQHLDQGGTKTVIHIQWE